MDEVGRGALAGPVVACCIILPRTPMVEGATDSKLLSPNARRRLAKRIRRIALYIHLGAAWPEEIDAINILQATRLAMQRAYAGMATVDPLLLLDGLPMGITTDEIAVVGGDHSLYSIACASIVAKVTRDRLMRLYGQRWPAYSFAQNVGYGTAAHRAALEEVGASPVHRKSFAPVREVISSTLELLPSNRPVSTTGASSAQSAMEATLSSPIDTKENVLS
ncbi:MAG: ribonuclease HII [Firmicutes bacterium]|nr:ribonuclease HII [Bacillota bacterium]